MEIKVEKNYIIKDSYGNTIDLPANVMYVDDRGRYVVAKMLSYEKGYLKFSDATKNNQHYFRVRPKTITNLFVVQSITIQANDADQIEFLNQ